MPLKDKINECVEKVCEILKREGAVQEIRVMIYSVLAWGFAIGLLWMSYKLTPGILQKTTSVREAQQVLMAGIGIPAIVGLAFYGKISNEIVGVLGGLIVGFIVGQSVH